MAPCPNIGRPISFESVAHTVLSVGINMKGGFASPILERIKMNIALNESDLGDSAEWGDYPDSCSTTKCCESGKNCMDFTAWPHPERDGIIWYLRSHRSEVEEQSLGDEGVENGGVGAREFAADNRFLRLERGTGSMNEGALDFGIRSMLVSVATSLSRGALPFKISFSLSGSSSKST